MMDQEVPIPARRCNMDTISFSVMSNLDQQNEVVTMMRRLYEEDESAFAVDYSIFPATLQRFISHPYAGQIVLFRKGSELRGYALLVPYWSNEFGGTLLFVDELFVVPGSRNRGIARSFFEYLEQQRPFEPVALGLGVSPANSRARRLYDSLGFVELRNKTLTRPLRFDQLGSPRNGPGHSA
jgi:GNAT superfamily N-acetyltransferase